MKKIIVVTKNAHKVQEIGQIFPENMARLYSLADIPKNIQIVENGNTFEENALSKNICLLKYAMANGLEPVAGNMEEDCYFLADDSGLEVDALNGEPGIHSARFASPELGLEGNAPDAENNAKLLRLLGNTPDSARTARFKCVLALTPFSAIYDLEDAILQTQFFEGACEGRIGNEPQGLKGFGYDPLFIPLGYSDSLATLGESVKNQISHRSRALEKMVKSLEKSL